MLTLLINETKPLAGLFASTTGGIGSVPDISVADEGQAVSVQTFTRTAGVITDSFVAGDVLHIGIGDGVNAPVCYIELSSASPATGTMAINTVGMVALFAATVANRLSLQVGVVRTRGGYTNTIFSAPIVIHRSVIDPDTAVPTPSILGTGVAAALQVAINTALGFVRLDASARLPAVDGSQLTNLPNTGGVTSITGTANEITVTGTTTPTLSLPSALTFTGKTVTGGTFTGGAFNGTVGATTPSTIAGTTASFGAGFFTVDADGDCVGPTFSTIGGVSAMNSSGDAQFMSGAITLGANTGTAAWIHSDGTFSLVGGAITCGNGGVPSFNYGLFSYGITSYYSVIANNGAVTIGSDAGTVAWINNDGSARLESIELGHATDTTLARVSAGVVSIEGATILVNGGDAGTPSAIVLTNASGTASININGTVGATTPTTGVFTTLTASATTSLLLGTAGSAVGTIGFRNATSGTTTLAPATGALGTGTVTLPLSGTLAISSGAQTFTGVQSMTSPDITTSITTPSTTFAIANATATTLNIGGAATTIAMGAAGAGTMNIPLTTSASSSTTGSLKIGNGTAATNVGIGGGNINAGGTIAAGGAFNVAVAGIVDQVLIQRNGAAVIRTGSNNTELYTTYVIKCGTVVTHDGSYLRFTGPGPTIDTSLSRNAAGVLQIGNTFNNALGSLLLTNLTASGNLAVTGATTLTGLLTANGGITLGNGQNIAFNTTTGTKIGATTSQKLSFWNATPIVQPTTAVASATVVHTGGGTNLKTDDTFDGYTLAQVVKALRNAGLLA